MCNIRWYVISTDVSVIDLLIEAFLARLWASRDSSEEAMKSNLVV